MQSQEVEPDAGEAGEVLEPDPRARVALLAALAVGAVAATVALWWLQGRLDALEQLAGQDPARAARETIALAGGFFRLIGWSTAAFGVYFLWLGARGAAQHRFPPRGTLVLRPTPIERGDAARRKAILAVLVGLSLIVAGVLLPLFADGRIEQLVGPETEPVQTTAQGLGADGEGGGTS